MQALPPEQQPKFKAGEKIVIITSTEANSLELVRGVIDCICIYEDRCSYYLKGDPEAEVSGEGMLSQQEALESFSHFIGNE